MASLTKVTMNKRDKRDAKKAKKRQKKVEISFRKREAAGELLVR